MTDPYRLSRFVAAQDDGGTYDRAVDELRRGRKTSHWMWFIFPQVSGLGHSATAKWFAISSRAEAIAYLDHEVLGARLLECTQCVAALRAQSATQIFGVTDAQKLRSSMTLFLRAAPDEPLFGGVLATYFAGIPDIATDERLK